MKVTEQVICPRCGRIKLIREKDITRANLKNRVTLVGTHDAAKSRELH